MNLVSFRAYQQQNNEIKFPVHSVPIQPQSEKVRMSDISYPTFPQNDAFIHQESNNQPSQSKRFSWDGMYKFASLGIMVVLAVLMALSLKPIIGNPFKNKHSASAMFENFKNNDNIITLSKLPGMHEVKEQFQQKVINPMKNKDLYKREHVDPGMLCVLYGPPGTGKTNFVKSAAKEVDANVATFKLATEGSIFSNGTSINIHEKAVEIAKHAKKHPDKEYFVLFDEVEAILSEPQEMSGNTRTIREEVIKTFLQTLDMFKDYKNIRVFATTNQLLNPKTGIIGDMNKAAMDRFATKIYVGNPDVESIASALKIYLEKYPSAKDFVKNPHRLKELSKRLKGYSFRNIEQIKDGAVEIMMNKKLEAIASGKNPDSIKMTQEIFEAAIDYFAKNKNEFNVKKAEAAQKAAETNKKGWIANLIAKISKEPKPQQVEQRPA